MSSTCYCMLPSQQQFTVTVYLALRCILAAAAVRLDRDLEVRRFLEPQQKIPTATCNVMPHLLIECDAFCCTRRVMR